MNNDEFLEIINDASEKMEKSLMLDLAKSKQKWMKETFGWDFSLDEVEKIMEAQWLCHKNIGKL